MVTVSSANTEVEVGPSETSSATGPDTEASPSAPPSRSGFEKQVQDARRCEDDDERKGWLHRESRTPQARRQSTQGTCIPPSGLSADLRQRAERWEPVDQNDRAVPAVTLDERWRHATSIHEIPPVDVVAGRTGVPGLFAQAARIRNTLLWIERCSVSL
jgi:hypothetical protein